MVSHIKNVAMTTVFVLIGIYALRQVGFTAGLVDKAIKG